MKTAPRWRATAVLAATAVFLLVVVEGRPNQVMTPGEHSLNSPFVRRRSSGITRRSTTTPDILRQHLKQALSKCNSREPPPTQKILLKDKSAVCNDGSPAGYFIRKSYGSKRWIVFLEGGWYCYDKRSCESRWSRLRGFMTSNMWPDTRQVSGILSPDPEENPYWWNANHVYVPYCSSDSWSGSAPAGSASRFAFMGSVIIQEVLRDLLSQGLLNASKLMLTGSSAGGTGVMLNLDRVTDFLRTQGSSAEVRGVTDSGWFLDNVPYAPADCQDPQRCAPTSAVQMGHALWNGQVPLACKAQYASQPWRCYFGHHLHRTLKTPLFIFQWLFDEAQMLADNVGPPMSKEQWDYIHAVGDDLRRTFTNVSAVFSPSCISHTVLTKRDWQSIRIGDISLPQALRCWELQPYWSVSNHLTPNGHQHHHRHHHRPQQGTEDGENEQQNLPAHSVQHALRHGHKRYKAANVESNPIVLLADDPEMPANTVTVKPAKNLVRSGQRGSGGELAVGTANATLIPSGRHKNGTRKNKEERRKGAGGRKRGNKKVGENKRNNNNNNNGGSGGSAGGGSNSGTGAAPAKSGRRHQQQQLKGNNKDNTSNHSSHRRNNHNNKDKKRKKDKSQPKDETTTRPRREAAVSAADPTPASAPEFCQHRLVDRCTWPQCNRVCPKLHNPFTGEEMDFIQLLKSFGLDMSSVANALGIDMHTLNNMDHDVLLHLLTQQTN